MTTRQNIEDYINSLPPENQQKARQFQWKIDQTLNRCKDDTQRYNKMVELFWEGVVKFEKVLNDLKDPSSVEQPKEVPDNVITFHKIQLEKKEV